MEKENVALFASVLNTNRKLSGRIVQGIGVFLFCMMFVFFNYFMGISWLYNPTLSPLCYFGGISFFIIGSIIYNEDTDIPIVA